MLEIFGFVGALLIGVVLGLIGGGGSILTVPIFVYIIGIEPVLATAYSLFVVGITALVGALRNALLGTIDFKAGVIFAIPAFIGVFITRQFLMPSIPQILVTVADFQLMKNTGIMLFFAVIMFLAAYFMIKSSRSSHNEEVEAEYNYLKIIIESLIVGVITGLVGAGGGFLIIPALVLLAKLPIKTAIGTSLFIIATKSLLGFLGDIQHLTIDWSFLLGFSSLSIMGIFVGLFLNKIIDGKKLKESFGWVVLTMAFFMLLMELI